MAVKNSLRVIIKRRLFVLMSTLSLMSAIAIPGTAQARGSVHIDIPGLSIGVHDDHYGKKKRYRRVYRDRHYDNDRYHRKYRDRKRSYYKNRYYNRYYNYGNRYDNYYGGRSDRYRYRNRRVEVCPDPGYSPYYNDNLSCYRHEDHFHCS